MPDEARLHITNELLEFLKETFSEEQLISDTSRNELPFRSQDLTPVDF